MTMTSLVKFFNNANVQIPRPICLIRIMFIYAHFMENIITRKLSLGGIFYFTFFTSLIFLFIHNVHAKSGRRK